MGATWACLSGRTKLGAVLVAFAFLTRYDAALFATLYFALTWVRDRRVPLGAGLLSVAIVLPWLAFAQWYFGSVFPNTLGAKTGDTGFRTYLVGAVQRQWNMSESYLKASGFASWLGGKHGPVLGSILGCGAAAGLAYALLKRRPMELLL